MNIKEAMEFTLTVFLVLLTLTFSGFLVVMTKG